MAYNERVLCHPQSVRNPILIDLFLCLFFGYCATLFNFCLSVSGLLSSLNPPIYIRVKTEMHAVRDLVQLYCCRKGTSVLILSSHDTVFVCFSDEFQYFNSQLVFI